MLILLLRSNAGSTPLSLGGPDSVIIYRQKETFRRQAELDAAANIIGRRRRSAAHDDTSSLSLLFAVSNVTEGVLLCSRSSDKSYTVLYVRVVHSFMFTDLCGLLLASVVHSYYVMYSNQFGSVEGQLKHT